jgi:predicted DNA-binding protein with PD1-like motif
MKTKVLNENGGRTIALVFQTGDEVMAGLQRFANEHDQTASHFTGIGAFSHVTLGYFDWQKKDYERITVDEQVEVLALVGDIALEDGKPKVHAHVVLGNREGMARGGHLLEARVRPTLEVIVEDTPGHLRRRFDRASRLALIDIGE